MHANQSPTIARDREPTAAQLALNTIEELTNELRRIKSNLEEIAEHVGQLPKSGDANGHDAKAPRPVRSGIIGAIHDASDANLNLVAEIESLIKRISTQI